MMNNDATKEPVKATQIFKPVIEEDDEEEDPQIKNSATAIKSTTTNLVEEERVKDNKEMQQ